MVEAAERHVVALGLENVECHVLDAERLDLPDDAVDGVLCRWGYMLMPNPEAAFAETHRVLRSGGRLSCAVFGRPEQNPWARLPSRVLQERGHMPPPDSRVLQGSSRSRTTTASVASSQAPASCTRRSRRSRSRGAFPTWTPTGGS
jgi:ubiquinone/menaquinone biosynthesis C-methylase UbiE